jgi:hypothetical protein
MDDKGIIVAAIDVMRSGWRQRPGGENANGERCWPTEPEAVAVCADGALLRVFDSLGAPAHPDKREAFGAFVNTIFDPFVKAHFGMTALELTDFNEAHSRDEVIALFENAAEAL